MFLNSKFKLKKCVNFLVKKTGLRIKGFAQDTVPLKIILITQEKKYVNDVLDFTFESILINFPKFRMKEQTTEEMAKL